MKTVRLPTGEAAHRRADEVTALRLGLDLGMTLIDTAEMYGEGGAEEVVAEAIRGRRDQVFLVSKVYPHNASRHGAVAACERSLKRLGTDMLDLYLLHWRGDLPLAETLEGLGTLVRAGKIRHWGVSNFDTDDMVELRKLTGGAACATDQVLYNLTRRGIEWSLLPWCRRYKMPVMAYSPLEQGRLGAKPALRQIARRHGAKPMQVALAGVLGRDDVIAIPKASHREHVRDNAAALALALTREDLAALDRAFKPPGRATPLAML